MSIKSQIYNDIQNSNTYKLVETEIEHIINNLIDIDEKILNKKINDDELSTIMYDIRRKIFKLNIKVHELELSNNNNNNNELIMLKKKIKFMIQNFNLINEYNKQILQKNKKKAIDTLTIVNTIFLPLALITGYFGMNFKSMGVPSNKFGILTFKYGQGFVLTLFIFITIFIILLFYLDILPQ